MYTLGDVSRKGALLYPDKVAMVFGEARITYREMDNRVNRFANTLKGLGCKKGDRLTILAENTYKFMEVYFAAAKMGMSVTPLNFRLSDAELTQIVNDSKAVLYLSGDGYVERSRGLKNGLKNIRHWISLETKEDDFSFYEDLLRDASGEDPMVAVDENDMIILMYTGGTTGLPKGVMLSHRNILTSAWGCIVCCSFTRDDTTCFVLPLFHIALWPALCLLMVGGKVVICPRPDIEKILRLIQEEKCTHINLVPTLLGWMLNFPNLDGFNLSSLRLISYAGSPIAPDVLKRCIQKFGNIFAQGYGLTESAPAVSFLFPEDHVLEGPKAKLLSSAGRPNPMTDVRIVNESGEPLPPGGVGEIAARGKNIMLGYWKNPELTREKLVNGWLHTGDMGTLDEDGYLYLLDRKADMIVTGGENVYPKETEDVLYENPNVQECAVVSVPDDKWGELVQAVVVLKSGKIATAEELINHCKSKLAGYKCPKKIDFWETLPKSAIGKILRKEVKKHFWQGMERRVG